MSNRKPKLLLIRPRIPTDDFTSKFSYDASDLKLEAERRGWEVTELTENDTNRTNVGRKIREVEPDFIIHYDHGEADKLYGQQNNVKEPVLECTGLNANVGPNANDNLLSSAVVSTVSCSSAINLGQAAVAANTRNKKAYLGHNLPFGCEYAYWQYFQRAANEANIALLEGNTFRQAKSRGYAKYTREINNLLALPGLTKYVAAAVMWLDRESLTVVGNGSARAKP